MRHVRASVLLLGAILLATPGRAATVLHLDLPAAVAQATQVVHGTVEDATAHWSEDGLRIYTDVTLAVRQTLKGVATQTVRVRTLGGIVDGVGQMFPGAPHLAVGEEVVLLLQDPAPGQPQAPHRIVGLAQGVYRVGRADGQAVAFQELEGLHRIGVGADKAPAGSPRPLDALLAEITALAGRRP